MKKIIYCLSIFVILLFTGCDENPTQPLESITEEINDTRPFESIYIRTDDGNSVTYSPTQISFNEAYAEDGFLVVVLPTDSKFDRDTKNYYNLSTANEINIQAASNNISIMY